MNLTSSSVISSKLETSPRRNQSHPDDVHFRTAQAIESIAPDCRPGPTLGFANLRILPPLLDELSIRPVRITPMLCNPVLIDLSDDTVNIA